MSNIHLDEGMTVHGSKAEPLPVPVRPDYIEWEYREIGDSLGLSGMEARKHRLIQSILMNDAKLLVDRIVVEAPEQGRHAFYFDVTKNILDFGKRGKKASPTVTKSATPGRNERCPCGSGKKYKKCCMK